MAWNLNGSGVLNVQWLLVCVSYDKISYGLPKGGFWLEHNINFPSIRSNVEVLRFDDSDERLLKCFNCNSNDVFIIIYFLATSIFALPNIKLNKNPGHRVHGNGRRQSMMF